MRRRADKIEANAVLAPVRRALKASQEKIGERRRARNRSQAIAIFVLLRSCGNPFSFAMLHHRPGYYWEPNPDGRAFVPIEPTEPVSR